MKYKNINKKLKINYINRNYRMKYNKIYNY